MKSRNQRRVSGAITLRRILILAALAAIAIPLVLGTILVVVPAVSPQAGAETADFLRTVIGPAPVAELESISFAMHDLLNRTLASAGVSQPRVAWAGGTTSQPLTLPGGINILARTKNASKGQSAPPAVSSGPSTSLVAPAPSNAGVVTAGPQLGWQAYGATVSGAAVMARTMVMLDPQRSYAGVALVRMDLSQLALHIVPGTIEPAHPSGIDQQIPYIGQIAPQDQARLVAAFNGGFKSIHGHYGMMVNGITLLTPVDGMATLAVYKDGRIRIGAWGSDLQASPDMVSFRQNCPPLIDNGQINPLLSTDARKAWGFTNNSDITWRTAVGISQDGRFLIYAVGNGTDAQFLAEALQKAGAYNAMQLDINQYYAHFETYGAGDVANSTGSQLQAQKLLQEMIDERQLYLTPSVRDFFYLTAR